MSIKTDEINLNDFIKEKLINFKNFLNIELQPHIDMGLNITEDHKEAFNKQMDFFIDNIDIFITSIAMSNNENTDNTIKLFLSKYEIDIDKIKNEVDYDKIKRYIEMFYDVIKKYVVMK